jgi:beta-mannanase
MTIIGNDSLTDLQDLASGKWDQVLNQVFQMWASAGYAAFYLRPGYEMNVSLVTSGNTAQFVLAFQHIATLARAFKGASIQIVWNPNEGGSNSIPVDDYYPGDSFVDVIGLDIYGMPNNPDTIVSNASTGPGDFTLTAAINFAKAHKKPFSLPEAGGGADASFPALLASLIGNAGVYVAFVDFWDIDGGGALEWDQDGALSAAWQGAFATISSASAATIIAGGACQ